jgi:hypothetical protein
MLAICPSQGGVVSVSRFLRSPHKVWQWFWCSSTFTIHWISADGAAEDVFMSGRKPNRFSYSHSQPRQEHSAICSVHPTLKAKHWQSTLTAMLALKGSKPTLFLDVLHSWSNTSLWEHMSIHGGVVWLQHTILEGTLVAVTDGLYIRELYPNLCSAAFVLKCSKGRGRIWGSFSETQEVANTYRGELLGLLAIHLILLSINKVHPQLSGSIEVVSDYLGALKRTAHLPLYRIPTRCRHSDILKTIPVHCHNLSLTLHYLHAKAHQDNNTVFAKLSRKSQLNCICNHAAKVQIAIDGLKASKPGRMFPLEPIAIFVGDQKMTSDTGDQI